MANGAFAPHRGVSNSRSPRWPPHQSLKKQKKTKKKARGGRLGATKQTHKSRSHATGHWHHKGVAKKKQR